MVHLTAGSSNAGLLETAADLAARFDAHVIGIAACQPVQTVAADGYISGDIVEQDFRQIDDALEAAEVEFRKLLSARAKNLANSLEWRSTMTFDPVSDYVAREARSADLLITGIDRKSSMFDTAHHADVGDLVMRVGRPVLIVPSTAHGANLNRVLIGWKDTRETRRAIVDALPLLRKAAFVAVAEIARESELNSARARVLQVVEWLKRHGVLAEPITSVSSGEDTIHLDKLAHEQKADVIVAGAYGHNRLREWILGGVTRDLLLRANRCSLVSH
jgi:nucleotide-binding universal stress UspA family protein